MALDSDVQAHGLQPVPWGGIAARLSTDSDGNHAVHGRPYCLLPLPATTGLPVHVNASFCVKKNRYGACIKYVPRCVSYGRRCIKVGAAKYCKKWARYCTKKAFVCRGWGYTCRTR